MKNANVSLREIDLRISKVALSTSKLLSSRNSTQKASPYNNPPLLETPVGEKFTSQKYIDLLGYLVLYHYLPVDEKHLVYLHLDLEEHFRRNSESFWLQVLMDQELFLKWLQEQRTMTLEVFFSRIVNTQNLIRLADSIIVQFEETLKHPRRVIRRRGYKDKGSLPNSSTRAIREEEQKDIWLLLDQLQHEEKLRIRSEECQLLIDFLTKGEELSDDYMIKFRLKEENYGTERKSG